MQGHAADRAEPRDLAERAAAARRPAPSSSGSWSRTTGSHETRDLLEERARGQERRGADRGHQDRGLLLSLGAGGRVRGQLHQHPADAAVALQGRRPAGGLPVRHLVHPPARRGGSRACTRDSALPRDAGFRNLVWEFDPPAGEPGLLGRAERRAHPEGDQRLLPADPGRHLAGFADLKDDGSTTCASWIYCGVFPAPDRNLAAAKTPTRRASRAAQLGWGFAWPANRRIMYNRASADPRGRPWSERKKWVWWDGKRWTGYDVPDFAVTKAPTAPGRPDAIGLDRLAGDQPFIMKPDGVAWLYVPSGLVDGPLPTHYEPAESPVRNPLYPQQIESGAQVLEAHRKRAEPGRRPALSARDDDLPPHRAVPRRRDEPLESVADRAAARAVRRALPRAGRGEGGAQPRLGARDEPARQRAGQGAGDAPDARVHDRRAGASTRSACPGTGATRAS